jgi:hypothetical protein
MRRAEGFYRHPELFRDLFPEIGRIHGLAAYPALGQTQGHHLLPGRFQQVPEFHGLFRANPPALTASGAQAHVMHQDALAGMVPVIEGLVRTILDAGQATVTLPVHYER